jgi:hypothetical protein
MAFFRFGLLERFETPLYRLKTIGALRLGSHAVRESSHVREIWKRRGILRKSILVWITRKFMQMGFERINGSSRHVDKVESRGYTFHWILAMLAEVVG